MSGAGVSARCTVELTVLAKLASPLANDAIRSSIFFLQSKIIEIGVFGLQAAPQAHNCVRFFKQTDSPAEREDRFVGLLGMLNTFDSTFSLKLLTTDPLLAALIPHNPVVVGVNSSLSEVCLNVKEGFLNAQFRVEPTLLERYLASLLSKRFVLLTGLAGAGKTKLAEAFTMWLTESEGQYRVVAVGADWTSNENLLGYADALRDGAYQMAANGVLDLIIKADGDRDKPYFLILDEMNLSHVERYFADFLSAMESANSTLRLHGVVAGLKAGETTVPHELALPENLFIIGTVNVDETTYMFSPKVLDRANVIEFRATHDQMAAFLDDPSGINLQALTAQGAAFAQAFVRRSNADADIATLVDDAGTAQGPRLKLDLLALFTALAEIGAEFGFRTAKEIARFMVIHKELSGTSWQYKDALDAQVLQKLMPKLHGSARKLDGVLNALSLFATANSLPLTLEKVNRMQLRLKRDGFTSFAEA